MTAPPASDRAVTGHDAESAAEHLRHDLRESIEDDVPTFTVGLRPPYAKVEEFEARIRDELQRAFAAGAGSGGD